MGQGPAKGMIVVALGGNALLRRGERLTAAAQRANVRRAVAALAPLADDDPLVVTHGSGPQVGWLAARQLVGATGEGMPLDVVDAETEGMIGYLILQELANALPAGRDCIAVLTRIEVDPADPAFQRPDKPVGPALDAEEARLLAAAHGWTLGHDGDRLRRLVASPEPLRIVELPAIRLLVDAGVVVVCAGGGGIPVARGADGRLAGVEAVIDKDRASALLAEALGAGRLMLLTDVDAVYAGWGTPSARPIRRIGPAALARYSFAAGTMAPKAEAAVRFVERTGGSAHIGALADAAAVLAGRAGTTVAPEAGEAEFL